MSAKANSDIAANDKDADYLLDQFPKIAEFLIWPKLIEDFRYHEDEATKLKTNSRRRSFAAIFAIVCSLGITLLTNSQLLSDFFWNKELLRNLLAGTALALLIIAIATGKGILFGRKRDRWLSHRITAERIRQFYFQYLLSKVEKICTDDFLQRKSVIDARDSVLEKMMRRVDATNYRQIVREDGALQEARLVDLNDTCLPPENSETAKQFKDFWVESRFNWQSGYAIGQLDRKASPFPIFGSLADQKATLSALEFATTLAIVVLQCGIVTLQFVAGPDDLAVQTGIQISVLATSVLAIVIVGLQAYEDGWSLNEDFSRNRTYASYTSKLYRDFADARTQGDGQAQFRVMREMEDLAYFEMQQFLHAHSTSRFSL